MKLSIKSISIATLVTLAMSTSASAQLTEPGTIKNPTPTSGPNLAQLGGSTA